MINLKFRSKSNGVPILSKDDIDFMAEYILRDYSIQEGYYEKGQDGVLDLWAESVLPQLLAETFDVSIQAAAIRVKSLRLFREKPVIQQLRIC